MRCRLHIGIFCALLPLLPSCSTTRALPEGTYRLAENRILIDKNKSDVLKSDLAPYVKQRSNTYFLLGWNPFLNIYNWAKPGSEDGWSRFCRKIGQAPVVLDEGSIAGSRKNLEERLRYLGWYNSTVESQLDLRGRKDPADVDRKSFFAPFWSLYDSGYGSESYRSEWNLFDCILVNDALVHAPDGSYAIQRIGDFWGEIYDPPFLTQQSGRYKGTPFRSFSGSEFIGGYSDHYPTFIKIGK